MVFFVGFVRVLPLRADYTEDEKRSLRDSVSVRESMEIAETDVGVEGVEGVKAAVVADRVRAVNAVASVPAELGWEQRFGGGNEVFVSF